MFKTPTMPPIDPAVFETTERFAGKLGLEKNHREVLGTTQYEWKNDECTLFLWTTTGRITEVVFYKNTDGKDSGFRIEFRKGMPVRCKASDVYRGSREMLEFLKLAGETDEKN